MVTPPIHTGGPGPVGGPQPTARGDLGSADRLLGNQRNFGIPNQTSSPQMTPEQRAALEQHLSQASERKPLSALEISCLAIMTVTLPFALIMGGSLMLMGGSLGVISSTFSMVTDLKKSPEQKLQEAKERITLAANIGTPMLKALKEPFALTLQGYVDIFDRMPKKPWQSEKG